MNLLDMNALWIASALFAALLVVLTVVGIVAVLLNRHGPTIAELAAADAQLETKQAQLASIQEQIIIEQARFAEAQKKASEVAWLEERLSNLNAEIATLEPRRAEILEVQQELDRVVAELGDTVREATIAESELKGIRAEIEQGNRLKAEIESMARRRDELEDEIKRLQTERDDAVQAKRQLSDLNEKLERLTSAVARKEGVLDNLGENENAILERIDKANDEASASEKNLNEIREELDQKRHERASIRVNVEDLQERRSMLQAKSAKLEQRIKEMEDEVGDGTAADPLRDLKEMPSALEPLLRPEYSPASNEDRAESAHLWRAKKAIEDSGLRYHQRTIWAFHTALKISQEAPMTVLSGISGTGKTQLPRSYAAGMGMGFLPMPVQPRWDSPQDMLGFYNFIEKKYQATELARAMWQLNGKGESSHAAVLKDRLLLVLLDEMNLARVEYYFSEFLSRLELRPPPQEAGNLDKRRNSEILIEVSGEAPVRLFPGHNMLFAGTMNEDETTQALSDKVLDRGNMLRFPAPKKLYESRVATDGINKMEPISRSVWSAWRREISDLSNLDLARSMVSDLAVLMDELERPFGHRVGQAMLAYAANYPAHDGQQQRGNIMDAMSDQVEMRLLPKLRGLELDASQDKLGRLADHVKDSLKDEQLAEEIDASIVASADTGRFRWRGLTR